MDKVYVGFDLSLNSTGVAVLYLHNGKFDVMRTKLIELGHYKLMGEKLSHLYLELAICIYWANALAEELNCPLVVSKERPFVSYKFGSVEKLYMAHGILHLALDEFELEDNLQIESPQQVKKYVTGSGKASKEDVAEGILKFLTSPNQLNYKTYDITDAIAVAITTAMKEGFNHEQEME